MTPLGNVKLVRAAIDSFNRGDWDSFLADMAADFQLDLSRATGPEHGIYDLERTRHLLGEFSESWGSLRIEGDDFREIGAHVVAPLTLRAQGREGIEVPSRVTWVWTVRDGAVVRAAMYQGLDDALAAVEAESG